MVQVKDKNEVVKRHDGTSRGDFSRGSDRSNKAAGAGSSVGTHGGRLPLTPHFMSLSCYHIHRSHPWHIFSLSKQRVEINWSIFFKNPPTTTIFTLKTEDTLRSPFCFCIPSLNSSRFSLSARLLSRDWSFYLRHHKNEKSLLLIR